MRSIKNFCILICGVLWSLAGMAQQSLTDTNSIATISYPPLTDREGKGMQLPQPPAAHPRLCLTAAYIPALKEKINHPLLKDCWDKITHAAAYETDGYLPLNGNKNNNSNAVKNSIEAKALLYVLYQNEKTGREAVEAVLHYYATLKIDFSAPDVTREVGRAIVTGSLVYDWCYPLLTDTKKNTLVGRMETLASQMEIGWPAIKGSSITSHTVEAQLGRDMLLMAIATWNEKPAIYDRIIGRIMTEFVPARSYFYPAGYHHQGSAYGPYRYYWDMMSTLIFDRMGLPFVYGKGQERVARNYIYNRRPDGQMMRDGDDFSEQFTASGKWWTLGNAVQLFTGSYFKDPIAINEGLKERRTGDAADYIFDFLFFDPSVYNPTATKASLPLAYLSGAPYGAITARTSWEDGLQSSAVIATMKVQGINFSNHQHLDAGSFQLYYKGPLAVQSGIYQGTDGGYGSNHFKNYSQRTIAHNTMLVYDPNEKMTWHGNAISNDGGQPYPNDAHEPLNMNELLTQGYNTGEILAQATGPDTARPEFTYLKGELSKAYGKKVTGFQRSFVFLNLSDSKVPAALIVFDKVDAASPSFKKTWLLHCVEEPVIAQNTTTIIRGEKGYNGQLVNTTLLPLADNLFINKIGGKGNEFSVNGMNYPQAIIAANNSGDSAVWRIEVSPKNPSVTDHFLNVMQVMDYNGGGSKPLAVRKIETPDFVGAEIGDRWVLFGKTGVAITRPFVIKVSSKSRIKVLLTTIKNGRWKLVGKTGKHQPSRVITSSKQLLYFTVGEGEYLVTPVVDIGR